MVSLRDQTIKALRDQVADLTRERDEALAKAYDAEADRAQRMVECDFEVDRLRALLREVEWAGRSGVRGDTCVICNADYSVGHAPDCRLHAALEGRDAPRLEG